MKPRTLAAHDLRQFPILYVDDEAANLRIFELTFRREFTVLTAQSAEEGMRVLNENPVAVVLSDHKMPGMTGVEFLSRAREIDDHAVRILVTAYGDAETLGSAINDGRIYRYIPKPWDPDEMGLTLRRSIERYVLDRERSTLVEELTFLNWLSRTLHRELDPERVVRLLIDAAHNELGFDAAAVLFFTPDRRALRWQSIAPHDEIAERVRKIEMTRASAPEFFAALERGVPQVFGSDALGDVEGPVHDWISEVLAEEMVVVPLGAAGSVIGALAIDNRRGGRRFGADDRTLLESLSTQAVIALENARTVSALRCSREQLEGADRLGLLGRLSMGIARDLEAPLRELGEANPTDATWLAAQHGLSTLVTIGESAQGDRERGPVDLVGLIEEVAELVRREAEVNQIALVLDLDDTVAKPVGTRPRLQQLLLTLALNAIAVTPTGGTVRVRVRTEFEAADTAAGNGLDAVPGGPAEVCIEWTDQGPGFAPAELERLFDPFNRGPGAPGSYDTPEGDARTADLGLVVAHEIVREHGGSIRARSVLGDGATFEVRLPAGDDSDSGIPAA